MGKTRYSLDLNGATSGTGTLGGESAIDWNFDANGIESWLNADTVGGVTGWTVDGVGPFSIEQPGAAGLFELTIDQGTLDTVPTISIESPAPILSVDAPSGLTLTAALIARGTDTIVETVVLTERTYAEGEYVGVFTEDQSGMYRVVVLSGVNPIAIYHARLSTTGGVVHYAGDYTGIEDPGGLIPSATNISDTVAAALQSAHGSGSWGTANVSTLATATQLGLSSAQLLSGIVDLKATGAALLATTGGTLTAVNALPSANAIWTRIDTITGLPMERLVEYGAAGAGAGKVSGAGTGIEVFKHVGSNSTAFTVTTDENGNRTAVALA